MFRSINKHQYHLKVTVLSEYIHDITARTNIQMDNQTEILNTFQLSYKVRMQFDYLIIYISL